LCRTSADAFARCDGATTSLDDSIYWFLVFASPLRANERHPFNCNKPAKSGLFTGFADQKSGMFGASL
jgi:hypothetical protein